jgi:hypothetical protein
MATRTIVELISDLSHSEADETVTFGLDGIEYEIDLTNEEAAALREAFSKYLEAGTRKAGRKQPGKRGIGKPKSGSSPAEIRDWAKANGYDVPHRGRIPAEVRDAFSAAL